MGGEVQVRDDASQEKFASFTVWSGGIRVYEAPRWMNK